MDFIKGFGKIVAGLLSVIGIAGIPEDIETLGDWYSFYIAPNFNTSLVQWLSVLILTLLLVDLIRRFEKWQGNRSAKKEPNSVSDIDLPNISVGIRQHTWPELEETPAKTNIIEVFQENVIFTRVSVNLPYFLGKIAYLNKCVITNHSDMPLFKVILPMKIEFHEYDQKDVPHHTWMTDVTSEPISSLELNFELIEPVNANDSVTFWMCNETEHYAKIIFDEKLLAQTERSKRIVEMPYSFESINLHSVLQPNFKNMTKWLEEKNNGDRLSKEQVSEPVGEKYMPLSKAAQSLYEDLRDFDKGHDQITMAEGFREEQDGVFDYFAITISLHGEIFGKRPPSTKLERIPRKEIKQGEFRSNVSELFRRNGKVPEFTELVVDPKILPEILEWLKLNNRFQ